MAVHTPQMGVTTLEAKTPRYRERVATIIQGAHFIQALGAELLDVGPGWCEMAMPVKPMHWQQDRYVHAGVQGTLADHTAGSAACSLIGEEEMILTIEYKVNLLRPCVGERLRCRAEVLRPGRTLMVAESAVYADGPEGERLTAKAMVTLAVVPAR